jgi:hypothetical protein
MPDKNEKDPQLSQSRDQEPNAGADLGSLPSAPDRVISARPVNKDLTLAELEKIRADESNHPFMARELKNLTNNYWKKLDKPAWIPDSDTEIATFEESINNVKELVVDLKSGDLTERLLAIIVEREYLAFASEILLQMRKRREEKQLTELRDKINVDDPIYAPLFALEEAVKDYQTVPATDLSQKKEKAVKLAQAQTAAQLILRQQPVNTDVKKYFEDLVVFDQLETDKALRELEEKDLIEIVEEIEAINPATLENTRVTPHISYFNTQRILDLQNRFQLLRERFYQTGSYSKLLSQSTGSYTSFDQRMKAIQEKLDQMVEVSKNIEKKDPKTMSMEELAKAVTGQRKDPFMWKEFKSTIGNLWFDTVVNEFMRRVVFGGFKKGDRLPESGEVITAERAQELEKERLYWKIFVQITTLNNELLYEPGKASSDRSRLYSEWTKRQLSRQELLKVTTYSEDVETQKVIRGVLGYIIKTVASQGPTYEVDEKGKAKIDSKTGQKILAKRSDGTSYVNEHGDKYFDPGLTYDLLTSSRGMEILEKKVKEYLVQRGFASKDIDGTISLNNEKIERALDLALKLYTSLDLLTVSLTQLQKHTKTRGHNAGIKDTDRALTCDPEVFVHRGQRYGGADEDWSMKWLVYLPNLLQSAPRRDAATGNVYGRGTPEWDRLTVENAVYDPTFKECIGRDEEGWRRLIDLQKLLVMYEDAHYDTDGIVGSIEFTDFTQTVFPNMRDFLQLGTNSGKETENLEETLFNIDLYETAENGWMQMLEFTFKSLGDKLDKDAIVAHKGGADKKGGILHQFISAAGAAKMFAGRHLETCLEPMLWHLILRCGQLFQGTRDERTVLRGEIVKVLDQSKRGGLSAYGAQIDRIIYKVQSREWDFGDWYSRSDTNRKGIQYLQEYYYQRNEGLRMPAGEVALRAAISAAGPNAQVVEDYRDHYYNRKPMPKPLLDQGDLYAPSEKGSH